MAEYFHGILTINPKTGSGSNNWLALPALQMTHLGDTIHVCSGYLVRILA